MTALFPACRQAGNWLAFFWLLFFATKKSNNRKNAIK
jgi:hypothetical protein